MGARTVVITDQFEETAFRALNLTADKCRAKSPLCKVVVHEHSWGEDAAPLLKAAGGEKFGLVVASDCLYNPSCHEVLLESARSIVEEKAGVFLVGYSLHGNVEGEAIHAFFDAARRFGFTVDKEWKVDHDRQKAAEWSSDKQRGNVFVKVLRLK